MAALTLKAKKRAILGKKVRFLRRQGLTPAHLFGHNVESAALECDTAPLEKLIAQAGTTRPVTLKLARDEEPRIVLIRDIQRDILTGTLLHVDLYQMTMTEKVSIDIPIVLTGESPAMKAKGRTMLHPLSRLTVRCLPSLIPPQIEVDLGQLAELGQGVYVKDVKLGPEVAILSEPEQLIVKVVEAAKVEEEVVAPKAEEVAAAAATAAGTAEGAPAAEEATKEKEKGKGKEK